MLLASAGWLAGCQAPGERAAPLPESSAQSPEMYQGGSADVVFSAPTEPQTALAYFPESLPEYWRRDGQLAVRSDSSVYPLDAWPGVPAPSIFLSRQIRVTTTSDSFYMYRRPGWRPR